MDIKQKRIINNTVFWVFLVAQIVLYSLFLTKDFTNGGDTTWLKYSTIILCFLFSLFAYSRNKVDTHFVIVAFVFTLISDLFLLVLNNLFTVGICTFVVVQITYFARLYYNRNVKPWTSLAVRLCVTVALYITFIILDMFDITLALAVFYFINLVANTVDAFILSKRSRKMLIFAIGLCWFILCDICVGLTNASGYVKLSQAGLRIIAPLMWLFYLPSQVLIVLSAFDFKRLLLVKTPQKEE